MARVIGFRSRIGNTDQEHVRLQKLMQAIHGAFPETPPHRGQHRLVMSHLTIAFADNDLQLDQIAQEACARLEAHLPLSLEPQQVIVAQENLNGVWSNVAELRLKLPE